MHAVPGRFRPRTPLVPALAAIALAAGGTVAVLTPGASAADRSTAQHTAAVGATALPYQNTKLPIATRVKDLLGRMELEDKVGQMTQASRAALVPVSDVTEYRIGSVLSGGGSTPNDTSPTGWQDMYDAFQKAALATPLQIPMIYGIDAVHGHNNVPGAVMFPHNIGLGATRDPVLVKKIGKATAEEVAATGLDWTFSPCLCVARDDRWGRTYESFSEDPAVVKSMTTIIDGYQGAKLGGSPISIMATAKHFIADGGTDGGDDQGDAKITEAELRKIHLPPFKAAVQKNVGAVMISFSSWNGVKNHGNKAIITGLLKNELKFKGFVVSDWGGIDQIDGSKGFTTAEVAQAINAGIDMVMVPDNYMLFTQELKEAVTTGLVPMSRIDDAVSRILSRKFEIGLFEHPYADRTLTSKFATAAHKRLARQAVNKSLVLLKNSNKVLPIKKGAKILVTGRSADNIGYQNGGWTITWQGDSGPITEGTTILQGIKDAAGSANVTFDETGTNVSKDYDVVIAVVGEQPYAEGMGDAPNGAKLDGLSNSLLTKLEESGVPTVAVLVTGRPIDISTHVDKLAGVVAAWLPGTEGAGVADNLFGAKPFTGKLPMTWPASATQQPINKGDGQKPLFRFGFGLRTGSGS